MDSLVDKIPKGDTKLSRCIFAGQDVKHYTEYKPHCEDCIGYNEKCEEKNLYKPYRDMISRWVLKDDE